MMHPSCDDSDRRHDLRYARDVVRDTPDIRKERVASAKRALRNGTLRLKGEELADKLLEDPLHEMQ